MVEVPIWSPVILIVVAVLAYGLGRIHESLKGDKKNEKEMGKSLNSQMAELSG